MIKTIKRLAAGLSALLALPILAFAPMASAATTVVTPTNPNGWVIDVGAGGVVNFVADATAPMGVGSARLTTNETNESNAALSYALSTPLALGALNNVSYVSKVETANVDAGALSFYLKIDIDGNLTTSDSTYLVYEPYWSDGSPNNAPVERNIWQTGDVATGMLWCTSPFGALHVTSLALLQ
ncbi:hypothetical protein H0V99_03655 [Candidatus Saccharibacteria bacterium]|nr:hypothetical protein [Candidatus Saccharibacteria bacterium]